MTTTLTTNYSTAVDAFTRASHCVASRPVLPILAQAVLDTRGAQPVLCATDLELYCTVVLEPAQATGPNVLLPVADVVKALRGIRGTTSKGKAAAETVTITRDGEKVTVAAFGRTLTIDGWQGSQPGDVDDYPAWPTQDDVERVAVLDAADLQAGLAFADTARGRDDTLPMLTGIRLEGAEDGTITYVATDRYRLTVTETRGSVADWSALLPGDTLAAVKTLTGTVTIRKAGGSTGTARLLFSDDHSTLDARLLEATFPAFRALIPTEGLHTWHVDRALLLEDVTAAASTLEKNAPVRVTFGEQGVTVDGCAPREASVTADAAVHLCGFNPRYLAAGLKAFKSTGVRIAAREHNKPHLITGQRPDGADGLYLIMPVRLPDAEPAAA